MLIRLSRAKMQNKTDIVNTMSVKKAIFVLADVQSSPQKAEVETFAGANEGAKDIASLDELFCFEKLCIFIFIAP